LASASAETAIDWRVDSALAVGRFLVGVGQGQVGRTGLQHFDQVLEKSWRICTIDRFEPRADASVRSDVLPH